MSVLEGSDRTLPDQFCVEHLGHQYVRLLRQVATCQQTAELRLCVRSNIMLLITTLNPGNMRHQNIE